MGKSIQTLTQFLSFLIILFLGTVISVQAQQISGSVTDATSGETLPGVNVIVKGTSTGTSTNAEGNFSLEVSSLQDTLIVSFVGYQTQEVSINGRSEIDIQLVSEAIMGEEMVVVGYGTQEKVNLTGSVANVTSERLESRSIANTGEGLQGVIPNLNITVPNGDPAESPRFNIRGFESINGGSPLILVDGVPMDINRINPNDIESISVLKDASAAAVYGARAAFGVVLVETKRGQNTGKVNVSLNTQWSMAKPIFNMNPVTNPHDFVLARNEANVRTSGVPSYDEDYVEGTRRWVENPTEENAWGVVDGELRYYGFNDYHNRMMTDFAPTQQHDLSISGGTENSTYYISLGHLNKDGYLKPANNENFKRYNILVQADFDVTDWLRLEEKVQYNSELSDKPHFYNWDVNINTLARVNPIMPVQFPDLDQYMEPGDREQYEQYIGMYFGGTNFFPYLLDGGRAYPRVTGMSGGRISSTGYHIIKHYNADDLIGKAYNTAESPAIILRYAEVLLNYAEARAELGELTQEDLDNSINLLRDRVGMPHLQLGNVPVDPRYTDDGVPPIIVEIRRERRVELFMEGHRYKDLKRWKQGKKLEDPDLGMRWNDAAAARYEGADITTTAAVEPASGNTYEYIDVYAGTDWADPVFDESQHYLWPIPLSALSQNPEIGQNPGW